MSRIHEALKKAEQERVASEGGLASSSSATPEAGEPPIMMPTPVEELHVGPEVVAPVSSLPAPSAMPSLSSPFSLDALARCPQLQWRPDEKTMLFFSGDEDARGMEEFRTLRSRLYHTREKMTLKKILVTSALPKEGKSFTAANLAQVLVRQHGRRVLLIDADLRAPWLHEMLGTKSSPGLTGYLQGRNDEFSIMQRGSMENLFFVPSGGEVSDPAELVANGRLKLLLQRVAPLFDWIILDSPPAVPVSDASILANDCDGVLMVVRSNSTPVDMARRARQEFSEQALVGVVLNGTDGDAIRYTRYYYAPDEKNVTESK